MPTEAATDTCHVFISRRTVDQDVFGEHILNKLKVLAKGRICFFDAREIDPGQDWVKRIGEELEKASILFLLLTGPPDADLDWLFYEAGWFKGLTRIHELWIELFECLGELAMDFTPAREELARWKEDEQAYTQAGVHVTRLDRIA